MISFSYHTFQDDPPGFNEMFIMLNRLFVVIAEDTEGCVRKCKRSMKNKKYQSCNGCNEYVVCMAKKQLMHMPCAADNEWDDVEKECVAAGTSTTCDTGYVGKWNIIEKRCSSE